ncbi:hypothetical protein Tco_0330178, partial [Tanacetum coccineum]
VTNPLTHTAGCLGGELLKRRVVTKQRVAYQRFACQRFEQVASCSRSELLYTKQRVAYQRFEQVISGLNILIANILRKLWQFENSTAVCLAASCVRRVALRFHQRVALIPRDGLLGSELCSASCPQNSIGDLPYFFAAVW